MPVAKRILIVQEIWDSVEDKGSIELNDETKAELDRRIDHHKSGNAKYYSLEESRKRNSKLRNNL